MESTLQESMYTVCGATFLWAKILAAGNDVPTLAFMAM